MNLGTSNLNRQLEILKMPYIRFTWIGLICFLALTLISSFDSRAQEPVPVGDPIVMRIIKLEYANAVQVADTLEPFLSPQGRIMAYTPTNSLIIKDRQSIVSDLVRIIKGRSEP